ncbi:hypothetical protein J8273_5155 [Carpediemonas membranifera]|uniref:Uncharacterized protein n=1 Tax=Carpediemonas membranifera TaxID=201153 RepID=A0A8J6B3G9_9EUKA|nr:hypothetical protein J8273_5155 [Carpediemonas membranifera]|eukprot:KAG9392174.1 hypothetical protein J8273_5155 [Carpediemonas membranifera]
MNTDAMERGPIRTRQAYEAYISRVIDSYVEDRHVYPFIRNPGRGKGLRRRQRGKADVPWHPFWVGCFNFCIPGLGLAIIGQKRRGWHYLVSFLVITLTCLTAALVLSVLGILLAITLIGLPIAFVLFMLSSLCLYAPFVHMIICAADGGVLASRLRRGYYVMPGEAGFQLARVLGGQFIEPNFCFSRESPEVPDISKVVNKAAEAIRTIHVRRRHQQREAEWVSTTYPDSLAEGGSASPGASYPVPSARLDGPEEEQWGKARMSKEPSAGTLSDAPSAPEAYA